MDRGGERGFQRGFRGRGMGRGHARGGKRLGDHEDQEKHQPVLKTIQYTSCIVCTKEKSGYKCPKCKSPYCSLDCFQAHKQMPCEAATRQTPQVLAHVSHGDNHRSGGHGSESDDDEGDRVPTPVLQRLESDAGVQECLSNPHVVELMREIDTVMTLETALKIAMTIPIFAEFADACLRVCDIGQQDQSNN